MTQPRRPDEIAMYARLRAARQPCRYGAGLYLMVGASAVLRAAQELAIPLKRACYLIEKWERKGWYQQSSFPPGGWFTPEAPEALTPVGDPTLAR